MDTVATCTAIDTGLVVYRSSPRGPKIGISARAFTLTESSTSASVRSASCCGIGNPGFSLGSWVSGLCKDCA